MSLDFLKQIKVEDVALPTKTGGGRRKEWNPTITNAIRVWKDGSIFPSQQLVERFSLEYGSKPVEVEKGGPKNKVSGNAFDIFESSNFPTLNTANQNLIILNVTPKHVGKTDAFGSTSYNEDGTPKTSVMDQGSATFGKDNLLPMLNKIYGIEPGDKGFIDLVLLGTDGISAQVPFELPNGKRVCMVPKEISRGNKAGEMTYARRESPIMFVLYPASMLDIKDDGAGLENDTKGTVDTKVQDAVPASL